MNEKFKEIRGFEGRYEIGNNGSVYSIKNDMFLKSRKGKFGYLYLILRIGKKKFTKKIHRLVAEAFIENPKNKPHINHKDGKKDNNYYRNLEWVTPSENRYHAYRTGLQKPVLAEERSDSKLKNNQIQEIIDKYNNSKISYLTMSKIYGVSPTTIADVVNKRKYKSVIGEK